VSTVAAVELGLLEYDRDAIHHFRLTHAAAEDVFRTLATEPLADRLHNPGLEPARGEVIVGGCCVLVSLFRSLGVDELLVSESDILDGLVFSLAERLA
jgi:exopolyphosphatase/guanosine-5'-triphosphate,3'-diphosphate pyrophosphatase